MPLTKGGAGQEVIDEMIATLVEARENDLLALAKVLGGLAFKIGKEEKAATATMAATRRKRAKKV